MDNYIKRFIDKDGALEKRKSQRSRNFVFQVKMHPMLVEELHNPVKLRYTNGMDVETGIPTKSYMSRLVEITDTQYKIIEEID